VVGFTIGSRGEVPGKIKLVIKNIIIIIIINNYSEKSSFPVYDRIATINDTRVSTLSSRMSLHLFHPGTILCIPERKYVLGCS
jgi:hypothetical protein